RLQQGAVRDEAAAALAALSRLAHSNPRLGQLLKQLEDSKNAALAQKLADLRRAYAGDVRRLKRLDEEAQGLKSATKALLLVPETGRVKKRIERLEEAARSDGGQATGEAELTGLLRAVQAEIQRIDKPHPEAWKTVADMLADRRSDAPTHTIRELNPANQPPI